MGLKRSKAWLRKYHSPERAGWVAGQSCSVFGCRERPVHNAHIGGPSSGRPWQEVIPLCDRHHAQLDGRQRIPDEDYDQPCSTRERFSRRYQMDLEYTARLTMERWEQHKERVNGMSYLRRKRKD